MRYFTHMGGLGEKDVNGWANTNFSLWVSVENFFVPFAGLVFKCLFIYC